MHYVGSLISFVFQVACFLPVRRRCR